MYLLAFLFVLLFENLPVVVGLAVAALLLKKIVDWLSRLAEKDE